MGGMRLYLSVAGSWPNNIANSPRLRRAVPFALGHRVVQAVMDRQFLSLRN